MGLCAEFDCIYNADNTVTIREANVFVDRLELYKKIYGIPELKKEETNGNEKETRDMC